MKKILNKTVGLVLIVGLFGTTQLNAINVVEDNSEEVAQGMVGLNCDQKVKDPMTCMACQVYFESRGESYSGQLAVAKVTLKRANNNSQYVCAKVFERKKKNCQFSWTCDDESDVMREPAAVKKAVEIAQQAFEEGADRFDHFYATYISEPVWAKQMTCETIGKHVFCDGTKMAGYKKVPAALALAAF